MLSSITQKVNQLHSWETQTQLLASSMEQQKHRRSGELRQTRQRTTAVGEKMFVTELAGPVDEQELVANPEEPHEVEHCGASAPSPRYATGNGRLPCVLVPKKQCCAPCA